MDINYIEVGIGIVFGLLISYVFYLLSLKNKKPSFAIKSINIIHDMSSRIQNLHIYYKNEQVNNLTISRILFWNSGKDTIEKQDITTINKLKIIGKEGVKILDANIIACNNNSSLCTIEVSKNSKFAIIDFQYLDFRQGFVVQLAHTGNSSNDIDVQGDIKGVIKIYRKLRSRCPSSSRKRSNSVTELKILDGSVILMGIVFLCLSVYTIYPVMLSDLAISSLSFNEIFEIFSPAVAIFISAIVFLGLGFSGIRDYRVAPKGLEVFYSNPLDED